MDENENLEDEQFNSMLSAAQKQVGVSPAAEEPPADDQPGGGSGKLSQAQIEAMLALNTDTFEAASGAEQGEGGDEETGDDGTARDIGDGGDTGEGQPAPEPDEDTEIAEKFRAQLDAEKQDNAEPEAGGEAEEPADGKGKKKAKKDKAPKEAKEKKPIDPVMLWRMLTVGAAVVALALGFCICLLFFTDTIKSGNEQFAIRAANAVYSKLPLNTELYVYRAYVHNGTLSDECMLYGLTSYGGDAKTDIYRVVVEKSSPSIVNIYYTVDDDSPEYNAMKNSSDSKKRIQASQLKSHSDDIYAADRQIQIKNPKWEKIDCALINRNINTVG